MDACEQVHSEKVKLGSQNQRTPDAPTFEERSIEWNLSMEEKTRKSACILHKNVYKSPGSHSENRNMFFKPSFASNVSSPSMTTPKERIHRGRRSFTSYDEQK